ncbi:RdgB/HAM1 family non-canonical purine NTP pyrophosphatase [Jatrophihabitans telluris]|uniref:dITP/XTP pyrophosphatase n=1 Tax=Jatrophihabitans telluris TaxID=2038343 RepID=A0ABY4R3M0_9ACTN|nr:RdgB/HAM1 family non-canonical purine NTP pyrophosphatase [Jatrophihabitans telluris]UQX89604.1 RdgB/HAM1 family non-canonical purine NTP pyrophosphatase [Jatrophihabitans telluris]
MSSSPVDRVLLATRNQKKLAELARILTPQVPVRVFGLDDVDPYDEAPETGATFADNALIKAREAVAHTGLISLGDDSGLAVDALNGMPGVLSARWSGLPKDDDRNVELLLQQLADTPDERLGAEFVCALALVTPDGAEHVAHGTMRGRLIRQRRGANGFGYDPIFVADGHDVTSAELSSADKDAISHRGVALRLMTSVLLDVLGG